MLPIFIWFRYIYVVISELCFWYVAHYNFGLMWYLYIYVFNSGNLVSIVVPGGSHGTHVAGIVGGYYKDDASLNDIVPGVQFVSIKTWWYMIINYGNKSRFNESIISY